MASPAECPAFDTVTPLRRLKPDGSPYVRPPEVESQLATLVVLPLRRIVERSKIDNDQDPDYLPSECLLHFFRRLNAGGDKEAQRELFAALRRRVVRAVRVPVRRVPGIGRAAEGIVEVEIREAVLDKFQELLCKDLHECLDKLDGFECRFNFAVKRLKLTALRDIPQKHSRTVSLNADADSNEPSTEAEEAFATMRNAFESNTPDFLYRSKLAAAITSLPPDERRVVELSLQGFRDYSSDENEMTISSIEGCGAQTVRNRRKRAFARLREVLKEEEAS